MQKSCQVRQSLAVQGFDGFPVCPRVGQKGLESRTESIRTRTKSIRPLPSYPFQVLETQWF